MNVAVAVGISIDAHVIDFMLLVLTLEKMQGILGSEQFRLLCCVLPVENSTPEAQHMLLVISCAAFMRFFLSVHSPTRLSLGLVGHMGVEAR